MKYKVIYQLMANYLMLCVLMFLLVEAYSSFTTAQDTTFIFNRFNTTSTIKYGASASVQSKPIRLTNHSERVIGHAFYDKAVPMKRNGSVISFSTTFVFAIVPQPRSDGGDGLCFVMAATPALNGGIASQYLGLVNTSSDGKEYNHIFAVEFDTVKSISVNENDSNHVGIDLNGVTSVAAQPAGYWQGNTLTSINLKSGHNIRAWIDYDGESKQLDISIAPVGEARPHKALLTMKDLNLSGILQDHMYVGFSASTGEVSLALTTLSFYKDYFV